MCRITRRCVYVQDDEEAVPAAAQEVHENPGT